MRMIKFFKDIPTLICDRLILRKITPADAKDMYEYASDGDLTEYLLWSPHPDIGYTRKYIRSLGRYYARGEFYDWGVELRENGKFIGTCGFASIDQENRSAEIGYVINNAYRGMGYAVEAARAVIRIGFDELNLNRIEARYMVGNSASERVMRKLGMTYEGVCREEIFVKGKYRDIGHYALLRSDRV